MTVTMVARFSKAETARAKAVIAEVKASPGSRVMFNAREVRTVERGAILNAVCGKNLVDEVTCNDAGTVMIGGECRHWL